MKPNCRHIFLPIIGMLVFLLGMNMPVQAGARIRLLDEKGSRTFQQNAPATFASIQQGAKKLLSSHTGKVAQTKVHEQVAKKRKIKFLIRHLQHQFAVRRVVVRENFELAPADDPDHEPMPDETWHTRPRYYIFLFRLCPF